MIPRSALFSLSFISYFALDCNISVYAQINTPNLKAENRMTVRLKPEVSAQPINNSIHSIRLIDSRSDTTSIGYNLASSFGPTNMLNFENSTADVLSGWLAAYLKLNNETLSGNQVVIFLRKMRVSDEAELKVFDNGHQGQANNGWDKGIVTKMEFYLQKDSLFYPLYRYDSVMIADDDIDFPAKINELITLSLKDAVTKLFKIDPELILQKARKITFNDIVLRHKRDDELPILNSTSFMKGAYASFEEFKANSPSIKKFEFKKGKMGDFLYVEENGTEYPERNVWGYCDGSNIYINSADKFSMLVRLGNTFYFRGIKNVTRKAAHKIMKTSLLNLATNTGEKKTAFNLKLKYYQIDMETGEVY